MKIPMNPINSLNAFDNFGENDMKNKVLIKQANSIKHICDKVYVNKNMTKILGICPYYKKSKKSIYMVALRKCLKESLFRILIWGIVDIAVFMIYCKVIEISYTIGCVIIALCILLNIVSAVLNIICFKGNLLENITVTSSMIIYAVNSYCDNINVSKNISINSDNYKRLDTLSQIVDTAKVRTKKLQLLLAMKNEFEYDWKYETDSVLLIGKKYSNSQIEYLNKIKSIDEDLLGIASRTLLK